MRSELVLSLKARETDYRGTAWWRRGDSLPGPEVADSGWVAPVPKEVREILGRVRGVPWLVLALLYGTGMRLNECLRLRVQHIDFRQNEITVRDGKGGPEVVKPEVVKPALTMHLAAVRKLHERD